MRGTAAHHGAWARHRRGRGGCARRGARSARAAGSRTAGACCGGAGRVRVAVRAGAPGRAGAWRTGADGSRCGRRTIVGHGVVVVVLVVGTEPQVEHGLAPHRRHRFLRARARGGHRASSIGAKGSGSARSRCQRDLPGPQPAVEGRGGRGRTGRCRPAPWSRPPARPPRGRRSSRSSARGRPSSSARRDQRGGTRAGPLRATGRGHAHQARDVEASVAGPGHERRHLVERARRPSGPHRTG